MPTTYNTIFGQRSEDDPRDREAYTNFAARQAHQGQSDAWAMNRDNLNFGVWNQQQNAQLSREAAKAQAEMAQNMLRMQLEAGKQARDDQYAWAEKDPMRLAMMDDIKQRQQDRTENRAFQTSMADALKSGQPITPQMLGQGGGPLATKMALDMLAQRQAKAADLQGQAEEAARYADPQQQARARRLLTQAKGLGAQDLGLPDVAPLDRRYYDTVEQLGKARPELATGIDELLKNLSRSAATSTSGDAEVDAQQLVQQAQGLVGQMRAAGASDAAIREAVGKFIPAIETGAGKRGFWQGVREAVTVGRESRDTEILDAFRNAFEL